MKLTRIIILFISSLCCTAVAGEYPIYTLDFDRYGPVKIGMHEKEAIKIFKGNLSTPLIPGQKPEPCHYLYPNGKNFNLGFMVEDGLVTRIDIYDKNISTTKGIKIGDSVEKVKNLYGRNLEIKPHFYIGKSGNYLKIKLGNGLGYVFETDAGKVTTFRSGKFSSISYVEGCL